MPFLKYNHFLYISDPAVYIYICYLFNFLINIIDIRPSGDEWNIMKLAVATVWTICVKCKSFHVGDLPS